MGNELKETRKPHVKPVKQKQVLKKLPFETEIEYQYRLGIQTIMIKINHSMNMFENEILNKSFNFDDVSLFVTSNYNQFKKLLIPERYNKVNEFINNSFEALFIAIGILKKAKEDEKNVTIAIKYLDEWTNWINLSNIYVYRAFEKVDPRSKVN